MPARTLRAAGRGATLRVLNRAHSYGTHGPGPFVVDELESGDPYELSDGHPVVCEPASKRHGRKNYAGATVIGSDPAVDAAEIDVGYRLGPRTLRAPGVSVARGPEEAGFARGAPRLAIEYVDARCDEADLERKIGQFLAAGAELVWVVRLVGERRVEVHRRGARRRTACSAGILEAPGILENPVPVDALFDRTKAHEVTLRNLLQRRGYADLDAVRAEGAAAFARKALASVLAARGLGRGDAAAARIGRCADLETLRTWLRHALEATSPAAVFRPRRGGAHPVGSRRPRGTKCCPRHCGALSGGEIPR